MSAVPRFIWVMAHLSGTRARGAISTAERYTRIASKLGDAAAFGQQSGKSPGAVLVLGYGPRQCRVQDLRRIGEFEFLCTRLRFRKHPFHRSGEILRPCGGLLQILKAPLNQTWH